MNNTKLAQQYIYIYRYFYIWIYSYIRSHEFEKECMGRVGGEEEGMEMM